MAGKTTYLANRVLNHVLNNAALPVPDTVLTLYVALFTTVPQDDGTGTEVAGGSYARAAIDRDATNFPPAANGATGNALTVGFAQATSAWGTVTGVAIFDAAVGGNMLFAGELAAPRTVAGGDTLSFSINSLQFTET